MIGDEKIVDWRDIYHPEVTVRKFVQAFWKRQMPGVRMPDPRRPSGIGGKVRPQIVFSDLPGKVGRCGRWVVRCPGDWCSGAEDVDTRNPVFMCCHCFNQGHGHLWLKVELPNERESIESLLMARPAGNRWWDGETTRELKSENEEHGITT